MAVTVATAAMALGHLSVEQAQTAMWSEKKHQPFLDTNSVPLGLLIGAAAAAVAIGLGLVFQGHANLPDVGLLATACVGVPLGMSVLYGTNIAFLRGRPRAAGRAMLVSAAAQCLCLVTLGATGHLTVETVVIVWVVSFAVSLAALCTSGGFTLGRPNPGVAGTTCVKGLRFHTGSVAAYLLLRSDVFLLNALGGSREVGIYTLAVTLSDLSRLAVDVRAQVSLPAQCAKDVGDAAVATARIVRFMLLLGVVSGVVTVAAVSLLILPLYGRAYAEAATVVAWLVPGIVLLAVCRPLSSFLLRMRSSRVVVLPSLIALAVNIGLNVVLIGTWGAVGCAVASTVAYTVLVGFQVTYFSRLSGVGWRCLLPTSVDAIRVTARVKRRCREMRIGRAS
ncbi:polysaccharide biosynthesis C-terminal domain-containing protein [Streptomyces sp. NPDC093982]|uniref:lipopolysaccharide biosynthesis protein n=1 Tax=Streptomyces sp. NPDC093982 TaxID=3155077 RepID=UPI0034477997